MEKRLSTVVVVALILVAGAIVCTWLLASTLLRARRGDDIIRVVGSARKAIRSDFIIWSGSITQKAPNAAQGYAQLQIGVTKAQKFLRSKGVPVSEIALSAVSVKTIYAPTKKDESSYTPDESGAVFRPVVGYELSQNIEVSSHKVDLVDNLSRQSTELISQGVSFESQAPMYLYTKMSELKITMQAEAAQDARNRAEQIATNAGCRLGEVRFARMNVPSTTPLYAATEDDGGTDDTSSLDKKITAIVVVGYGIR